MTTLEAVWDLGAVHHLGSSGLGAGGRLLGGLPFCGEFGPPGVKSEAGGVEPLVNRSGCAAGSG